MILEASVSDRVISAGVAPHRLRRVAGALLSTLAVLPGCGSDREDLFPEPMFMASGPTSSGAPNAPAPVAPVPSASSGPGGAAASNAAADSQAQPAASAEVSTSPAEGAGPVPEGSGQPALAPGAAPPAQAVVDPDPTGQARVCPAPARPLLLDFEVANNGPGQAVFGDFNSVLSGGTFVYPLTSNAASAAAPAAPGLTSDLTLGEWHIAGSVAEPAGFGLFLACQRLDASLFQGIAFRLTGSLTSAESLTVLVGTAGNEVSRTWLLETNGSAPASFGRCEPAVSQYDGTCAAPNLAIPVSPEPVDVFVSFAALAGGRPEPGVNPVELTSISWRLPDPAVDETGSVVPYAVDLRLDDIRLVEVSAPTPALITPVPPTPEPEESDPEAEDPVNPPAPPDP